MAGYSSKSLAEKLGIKPGLHVIMYHIPADIAEILLESLTECHVAQSFGGKADYVHVFVTKRLELEASS